MRVQCPACPRVHSVADTLSGRMGRCPCGALMLLPRHDDHPPGDALGAMMDMQQRGCRGLSDDAPAAATARPVGTTILFVAPFGEATTTPPVVATGDLSLPILHPLRAHRHRFRRGCFAPVKADVQLLAGHDPGRVLGSSTSGTLTVWADATGVWAEVPKLTADAQAAAGLAFVSPELTYHAWEFSRDSSGPVVDILSATLTAVAFVREGAFKNTGCPLAAHRRETARRIRTAAT